MRKRWIGVGASLFAITLGACGEPGTITQPGGSGQVSVMLTDAPSDSITAAVVTITDIYLQPGTDSLATNNRVYLRQNTPTTVDLLTLQGNLATLEQNATVPVGTYAQLRFVITGAYIEVLTPTGPAIYATSPTYPGLPAGAEVAGTLQAPSFAQSGLKVQLPGGGLTVQDGSNTTFVADFDVAQSFGHAAGNSGRWVLNPVVHAIPLDSLASLTVNVALGTGVTLPTGVALSAFTAQLTDAAGNSRSAPLGVGTTGTASATFNALVPSDGPFTVTLVAPAGVSVAGSTPALPASATLNAGANTQSITITSIGP